MRANLFAQEQISMFWLGFEPAGIMLFGNTYSCVHDACSMCSDGVCYVTDVDGVQMFVVTRPLHKYLQQIDSDVL